MEDLWRRYQRFAPLVDRLVVTEYDFVCNDDELHADYLRDVLTLSFSHPKMTAFINWGFWAGYHWKPEGTLIRKDWTERPAIKIWRRTCAQHVGNEHRHADRYQGAGKNQSILR